MTVPIWGKNIIFNYRHMFKELYGRECTISDEKVWEIFNTVFDDEDNTKQDRERVSAMRESELTIEQIMTRAQREGWAENWKSPQEMWGEPRPAGIIEIVWDEFRAWRRIWCPDGTVRRIPDGTEIPLNAIGAEDE